MRLRKLPQYNPQDDGIHVVIDATYPTADGLLNHFEEKFNVDIGNWDAFSDHLMDFGDLLIFRQESVAEVLRIVHYSLPCLDGVDLFSYYEVIQCNIKKWNVVDPELKRGLFVYL